MTQTTTTAEAPATINEQVPNMRCPSPSTPDDFTANRRTRKAKAIEVLERTGISTGELRNCLEAEDSYRAGGLSREDFVRVLEQAIIDRPDLAEAIRNIWATAWYCDEVGFLEGGI